MSKFEILWPPQGVLEEGPVVNNGFLEKQIRTISTMVSALSSEIVVSSLSPQYGGSVWFSRYLL